ncbi:hypothetical protein ABGB18_48730 [Nonomuraea sp. B12E4]|uniref:hypothetical protein n=1 Tax=Nonomuraea sp. B12E4 TaxID=3153564 RepID=UPI00325F83CF
MARKMMTNGSARPSLTPDSTFEQLPQPGRHLLVADQGGGEHGIGGREDRADQQ